VIEYIGVLIMVGFAAVIAAGIVGASYILGNRTRARVKLSPYECGMVSRGPARTRMTVRYYIVAILFLVFDLEILFLYPWAVTMRRLGLFGFGEMVVFMAILFIGYLYVWKKGALEWE
jgi:NADH-quinone oxidoreductase subunit A